MKKKILMPIFIALLSILITNCNTKKENESLFFYSLTVPVSKANIINELYVSYEIAGVKYIDSISSVRLRNEQPS